jgi:mannosyltransferase OCH1-like enzyme
MIKKYKRSLLVESNTKNINVGSCEFNELIINNPSPNSSNRYDYIPFVDYNDTFKITEEGNKIKIKRTDSDLGWGGNLVIEQISTSNIEFKNKIPKIIHQTFKTQDAPIQMIEASNSWSKLSPNWEYYFYDDTDCIEFIKKYFSRETLLAFLSFLPGAFKADLFRLCVLYIKGGVYSDSDTISLFDLDDLIEDDLELLVVRDDPMAKKWLWNGFIACTPKHPAIKIGIDRIIKNYRTKEELFYLDYSGPALFGKSVNEFLGNNIEDDYETTKFNNIKILKHSNGYVLDGDSKILKCEYPNKSDDKLPSYFWDNVQKNKIWREIPFNIIYTSYDELDLNSYMVDSFKKYNSEYQFNYFNQNQVDDWFRDTPYNSTYKRLTERGERTDFFRYCYLYENGGVYVDCDTFCNRPLDEWIDGYDLVVGLEGYVDKQGFFEDGFFGITEEVNNKFISVCNWAIATKPKHSVIKNIIDDITNNQDNRGVLLNTGPGRFTKHMIEYFGRDNDFTQDIIKGKSKLLSINRFGSNQSHSNSIKQADPFNTENKDIYITHMFDGTWRGNVQREKIKIIPSNKSLGISHNLTLQKIDNGFKGVARWDKDTERTHFMKKLGDCRSLNELIFDSNLNLISQDEKQIKNYTEVAKFEDFRHFSFNGKDYYSVSFIDENWNTRVAILDSNYRFIKKITLDYTHRMRFGVGHEVEWEKNYLFFEKDKELYLIYSTTPRYIVYKCIDEDLMDFEKFIDIENHHSNKLPSDQLYFSSNTSTGGSTSPIWIEEKQMWVYLIHTKIYDKKRYNHFSVWLDKDLKIVEIKEKPFLSQHINYDYFFVSSMINEGDYVVISGGISDNSNFTWKIPKNLLLK